MSCHMVIKLPYKSPTDSGTFLIHAFSMSKWLPISSYSPLQSFHRIVEKQRSVHVSSLKYLQPLPNRLYTGCCVALTKRNWNPAMRIERAQFHQVIFRPTGHVCQYCIRILPQYGGRLLPF